MVFAPLAQAADTGLAIERHTISLVSSNGSGVTIEEDIIFQNADNQNITSFRLWLAQTVQGDIKILAVDSGVYLLATTNGNIRECNLSPSNLEIQAGKTLSIRVTYSLLNNQRFDKTILYNTSFLSVTFDDKQLYQIEKTQSPSSFSLLLYHPTTEPLSLLSIVIILLILILIVIGTLLILRRQRSLAKIAITETEEIMSTKKTLLLGLLTELEKQHRAKTISDETYSKIKNEYKQQAVDVMKKLDDSKK